MTRPNLETELELIHKICQYLAIEKDQECKKCSYRVEVMGSPNCAPGCVLMAEELINIVRTGDPWGRGDGSWPRSQ
jgi:hypothetical protein